MVSWFVTAVERMMDGDLQSLVAGIDFGIACWLKGFEPGVLWLVYLFSCYHDVDVENILGSNSFLLVPMLHVMADDPRVPHEGFFGHDLALFVFEMSHDTQDLALLVRHAHLTELTGSLVIAASRTRSRRFGSRRGFPKLFFLVDVADSIVGVFDLRRKTGFLGLPDSSDRGLVGLLLPGNIVAVAT